MPAFRKGRVFFYFATFKPHIGVYPLVRGPKALIAELAPFRGTKGNLFLPHATDLPLDRTGRMMPPAGIRDEELNACDMGAFLTGNVALQQISKLPGGGELSRKA